MWGCHKTVVYVGIYSLSVWKAPNEHQPENGPWILRLLWNVMCRPISVQVKVGKAKILKSIVVRMYHGKWHYCCMIYPLRFEQSLRLFQSPLVQCPAAIGYPGPQLATAKL